MSTFTKKIASVIILCAFVLIAFGSVDEDKKTPQSQTNETAENVPNATVGTPSQKEKNESSLESTKDTESSLVGKSYYCSVEDMYFTITFEKNNMFTCETGGGTFTILGSPTRRAKYKQNGNEVTFDWGEEFSSLFPETGEIGYKTLYLGDLICDQVR